MPLNTLKHLVCQSVERIRIFLSAQNLLFIFDAYKLLVATFLNGVPELVRFID